MAGCDLPTGQQGARQAERQIADGRHILFIGHAGHPEVIGTFGQVPEGTMSLIETVEDVATVRVPEGVELAYLSQTTLSVDDTAAIIAAIESRFPDVVAPKQEDICYATSNRQTAVKQIAPDCEMVLVIGSPKSSNSLRLVEVAERAGSRGQMIQRASDIAPEWLTGIATLGLTAGASAPEALVNEVIARIKELRTVESEERVTAEETITFKLPRQLAR